MWSVWDDISGEPHQAFPKMSPNDHTLPTLFDECEPRDDVLAGELSEDKFAANLSSVAFDPEDAGAVYREPNTFFESTYPTDGLQELLTTLASRFLDSAERNAHDASILCLDTTFGGGKTHDLIASYHIATRGGEIPDLERHLLDNNLAHEYQAAFETEISPNVAVFSGGYVDARNTRCIRDEGDAEVAETKTMWGEIAAQLYGEAGYEIVADYDKNQTPPGENTMRSLFEQSDEPVLILIDEIAQYLKAASTEEVADSTLSEQTLVFMKSLLETASTTQNVTVVYSIADTAFTDEAEKVRREVKELDSIKQRQQRTITPTGDTEVSAVLRHRLFEEVNKNAAEQVAEAYSQFYRDQDRQLPQGIETTEYSETLERDYPFHPTVLRTLTEKIDSISDFQKTRDALRLLARALYHLWNNPPEHYDRHLVRLYDLTPADDAPSGSIQSKLRELFEAVDLSAAVNADIYTTDETAHAQREDRRWTEKQLPPLGSHIAITALWNSLAVGERALGLTRAELYEAVGHPQIKFDHYETALSNLTGMNQDVGTYYLRDDDRIKFTGDPKLLYLIDEYTNQVPRKTAKNRFEARLRREIGTGGFNTVPTSNPDSSFPEEPADLPDDPAIPTLAILHFDSVTVEGGGENVPAKIQTLYEKTAKKHTSPIEDRAYKNYILFLAPDAQLIATGIEKAQRLEGLEKLRDNSDRSAELTDDQYEEVRERIKQTKGLLGEQVRNVYRHLFYPERDGLEHVSITAVDAGDTKIVEAVETTLDDRILRDDDGARGEVWFKDRLWQQTKHRMSTQALAKQFAKKPGLPYLFSTKPLRKTVARMVRDAGYAYWNGRRETAYWSGGENPANWPAEVPIGKSPDVEEAISSTDVEIDKRNDEGGTVEIIHFLYEDMGALLEQHPPGVDIEIPVHTKGSVDLVDGVTEENDQVSVTIEDIEDADEPTLLVDFGGSEKRFEGVNAGTHGVPLPDDIAEGVIIEARLYDSPDAETLLDDAKTRVGGVDSRWEYTSEPAAASKVLEDTRDVALQRARSDATPGVENLSIEVTGESVLKKAKYIAEQALNGYENVMVNLTYRAKSSDESSELEARFSGDIKDFTQLNTPLERFAGEDGGRNVDLTFTVSLSAPEPITEAEDDILAELHMGLDGTGITLQVKASGPTQVEVPA